MSQELYTLWIDEKQAGPYTVGQLRLMWASGQITAKTLYWKEGNADWKQLLEMASKLEEGAQTHSTASAPNVSTNVDFAQTSSLAEEKTKVGPLGCLYLLAIFLPIIGIIAGIWCVAGGNTDEKKNGAPILVISLIALIVWWAIFFH